MSIKYFAAAVALAFMGTAYVVDGFDQQLAAERNEKVDFEKIGLVRGEAVRVMTENGCLACHSSEKQLPFYASLPGVSSLVEADIAKGLRHFNLQPVLENVKDGKPVSEVDLTKLQHVLDDNAMPPAQYMAMHWRSALSASEVQSLKNWIKQEYAEQGIQAPLRPIAKLFATDSAKVALGELLYHDARLSGDNTVSCASCHGLGTGGVDRLPTSTGVGGAKGPINAPTVFNAVYNIHQFWDGRAANLQAQAGGPPMNPKEMASTSWAQISGKLSQDPALVARFAALYPEKGISEETITDAIAEFEKTLTTPNSRFDQYLKGNSQALTEQELQGYHLFQQHKCATCHTGEALGGLSFELMGLEKDYFADRGNITEADHGRFSVTKDSADLHRFKVPTLRNVAVTYPYFHDASAKSLEEAVKTMARYQSGAELNEEETAKIAAFLRTLTGEYKGKLLQ